MGKSGSLPRMGTSDLGSEGQIGCEDLENEEEEKTIQVEGTARRKAQKQKSKGI